jgi:hypothetical protein
MPVGHAVVETGGSAPRAPERLRLESLRCASLFSIETGGSAPRAPERLRLESLRCASLFSINALSRNTPASALPTTGTSAAAVRHPPQITGRRKQRYGVLRIALLRD